MILREQLPSANPLRQWQIWGWLGFFAALFTTLGLLSKGAFNLDEVYHAQHLPVIWKRPELLLSYFVRPGFKLLYLLQSPLGPKALIVTNAIFSAITCVTASRIAAKARVPYPELAGVICASIPIFWLISFRMFAEVPATMLLALTVERFVSRRWLWAAFLVSASFLVRQEFAWYGVAMGVWFLTQRNWKGIVVLAWAPLALGLVGAIATGKPLWLISEYLMPFVQEGKEGTYGSLFLSLGYIFSSAAILIASVGILQGRSKLGMDKLAFFTTLVVMLMHFAIHYGMSKGLLGNPSPGHWRMLAPMSPFVAVFAAAGVGMLAREKWWKDWKTIAILAATLILIVACFSFKTDYYFIWTDGWREQPLVAALVLLSVFLFVRIIRLNAKWSMMIIASFFLLNTAFTVRLWKMGAEERLMAEAAQWVREHNASLLPIQCNNVYFYPHAGLTYDPMDPLTPGITPESIQSAPAGAWFVYDSHFGYKPTPYNWTIQEDSLPRLPLEEVKRFCEEPSCKDRFHVIILRKKQLP